MVNGIEEKSTLLASQRGAQSSRESSTLLASQRGAQSSRESSLNEILTLQEYIVDDSLLFFGDENIEEDHQIINNISKININNVLEQNNSMNIIDSINDFNEKINDYRVIEHKILVNEKDKNVKTHILVHLENQIEYIETNFEKITHKQFDNIIDNTNHSNEIYKIKLSKELNDLLGFSLEDYNQKSVKIEICINEICSKINNYFTELQNDIYNLYILNQKLDFISNYENETILGGEKSINKNEFFELVDKYESIIKNKMDNELKDYIKKRIEAIHNLFNMLKLLQEQLYVKIVTKYSCGICLSNNIESYYNNCGHVICKSCGIKNRNNNVCPFCKRESALKSLFFI